MDDGCFAGWRVVAGFEGIFLTYQAAYVGLRGSGQSIVRAGKHPHAFWQCQYDLAGCTEGVDGVGCAGRAGFFARLLRIYSGGQKSLASLSGLLNINLCKH